MGRVRSLRAFDVPAVPPMSPERVKQSLG